MKCYKKDLVTVCKCGCGTIIKMFRSNYDRVYYVKGHQKSRLGKPHSEETKQRISNHRQGIRAWNKGKSNTWCKGERHHNWLGDSVGYGALHSWLYRNYGKPVRCEKCLTTENVQWANISYTYKRNIKDWIQLCSKCHNKYDRKSGHWGEATRFYL